MPLLLSLFKRAIISGFIPFNQNSFGWHLCAHWGPSFGFFVLGLDVTLKRCYSIRVWALLYWDLGVFCCFILEVGTSTGFRSVLVRVSCSLGLVFVQFWSSFHPFLVGFWCRFRSVFLGSGCFRRSSSAGCISAGVGVVSPSSPAWFQQGSSSVQSS